MSDRERHLAEDPHRGPCRWDGKQDQTHSGWFSLLDWAVYHGPAWRRWQEFRISLLDRPVGDRAEAIRRWHVAGSGDHPSDRLATSVRCVNALRSLRGQFAEHPELAELLKELNVELESRWEGPRR